MFLANGKLLKMPQSLTIHYLKATPLERVFSKTFPPFASCPLAVNSKGGLDGLYYYYFYFFKAEIVTTTYCLIEVTINVLFFFLNKALSSLSHLDFVLIKACIDKTFEIYFVSVK